MRLYVGNVSRDVTEEDLREAFQAFGKVDEVHTITQDDAVGFSHYSLLQPNKRGCPGGEKRTNSNPQGFGGGCHR